MVIGQQGLQNIMVEIRPVQGGKNKLGIGKLPGQKIQWADLNQLISIETFRETVILNYPTFRVFCDAPVETEDKLSWATENAALLVIMWCQPDLLA